MLRDKEKTKTCLLWFHFVVKLHCRSSRATYDSSLSHARLSSVATCSCCHSFIFLDVLSESPGLLHGWGRWVAKPLFDVWPSEFGQWKAKHFFPHHYKVLHFACIKLVRVFESQTAVSLGALLCVLCGSQNKQRLFPYTTLTDWFV